METRCHLSQSRSGPTGVVKRPYTCTACLAFSIVNHPYWCAGRLTTQNGGFWRPAQGTGATLSVELTADGVAEGAGFDAAFTCTGLCPLQKQTCQSEAECTGVGGIWTGDACEEPCGVLNPQRCQAEAECVDADARLVWSSGACANPCGAGVRLSNSGVVSTHGSYKGGDTCTWTLTCSAPTRVPLLTFDSFHTEAGYDFVSVYDGDGAGAGDPRRLHGQAPPDPVQGTHQALTVQLVADARFEGDGFHGSFVCTELCGITRAYYCESESECTSIGAVWIDGLCRAPCGVHNIYACQAEAECQEAGAVWTSSGCGDPCDRSIGLQDGGVVSTGGAYEAGHNCRWVLSCSAPNMSPLLTFSSFNTESDSDFVGIYNSIDATGALNAVT